MSNLLIRPNGQTGLITKITPQSAGWTYVGFEVHKLKAGQHLSKKNLDREACLVWLAGKASARTNDQDFGIMGKRMSVFDGEPSALYVPSDDQWTVTAKTDLELAVCTAPGWAGSGKARAILADDLTKETRGQGTNTRYVTNILPEDQPADSLLVVEVITPGGHTSSYPPHKHDEDNLPHESRLEETYYHKMNPQQGFGFQRVYTDDRSLDETMAVCDGDVVMVPKGYHPVAACHGYDIYYLNVMAGPKRTWKFHNAPEHEWLLSG